MPTPRAGRGAARAETAAILPGRRAWSFHVEAEATLVVYNSCARLLAGDLVHTVRVDEVQHDLARFPADWPVVGVGTTDWNGRNGEMMPDGTAGALHFWWADPGSASHAALHDDADPSYVAAL